MAAAVAEELNELTCVLIPLSGTRLLLPNVSVAEILPWRRTRPAEDAPDWCLGELGWRGKSIPIVRFELLNDPYSNAPRDGRCLIVMNRARFPAGAAFYALAAEGLPRMVQLAADDVSQHSADLGMAEVVNVVLGTEGAVIPNLELVEREVARLPRY